MPSSRKKLELCTIANLSDSRPSTSLSIVHPRRRTITMSFAVSRAVVRQSRFAVRRAGLRNASTTSEAAGAAKEKAAEAGSKIQSKASEGLTKVKSSADSAASNVAGTVNSAASKVQGRTGRLIGTVQGKSHNIQKQSRSRD